MKVLINMNKTLSGRSREFLNKSQGKVQFVNPKSSRGRSRDLFITKFKGAFSGSFITAHLHTEISWKDYVMFNGQ